MIKTSVSESDSRKAQKPLPASGPVRVAPLFRRIDWLALLLTFVTIFVTYFITLAPELTLEDSGELVTGSFYAGIPHPPGYPVWTIYSWLWTQLLPIGNMAWRVAVAEAFSGALACGLIALMVSRGSSLFMEGIEALKTMTGRWEGAICLVCGFVAGALMGLDGFMWKESVVVNRIAVFSVPWMLMLLVCLLRWIYAPHQMRYVYLAAFLFGVCLTTHQSLIVTAMAFEIALAAGSPKLGRDAFFGNFVVYALYILVLIFTGHHMIATVSKPGTFVLFNFIGLGSLVASLWLATQTRGLLSEFKHVIIMALLFFVGVSFYLYMPISGMTDPPMQWGYPRTVEGFFHALTRGQYEQPSPTDVITDPGRFFLQMWMLIEGMAEEFSWAFLFVALVPFLFFRKVQRRERAWLITLAAMYFFLGCFLMVLLNPSHDRASADLIKVFLTSSHTIVTMLIGYGLALTAAYMATHYQRFRIWGLVGGAVAMALAIYSLWDTTGTHFFGRAGSVSFPGEMLHWIGKSFAKDTFGLPVWGSLVLVGITGAFIVVLLLYRNRGPLLASLALFMAIPVYSGLSHWWGSEQRNHWFGYWFGHDMFSPPFKDAQGKPLYPEMTRNAVLYGGTDPGRFCPEYMIYTESFTPHNCQPKQDQTFDRRDVYIITQNALADGTYLCFVRSHYNRSTQIDPPFFQDLLRSEKERMDNYETNTLARMVRPLDKVFTIHGDKVEKRRRTYTSWFKEQDFTDLPGFVAKLRGVEQGKRDAVSEYLYQNLTPETQQLLGSTDTDKLRTHLATDLNTLLERELVIKQHIKDKQQEKAQVDQTINDGEGSDKLKERQAKLAQEIAELSKTGPLWDPARFKQVPISDYLADFIKENPQSHTRIRLNRLLLEAAYPKEIAKSIPGVYPDREIYIATPDDSQRCFSEYLGDAQKRLAHDSQFPNEPRQLKPGEDVKIVDNRVTVAGQVAVMAINGLLTKVMFDHNPNNEFFVEESFPLDWMYPHLTPFGVIMKVNRQTLPDLTEDILSRDHEFWRQYSGRLCGDWITYDTSVQEICDWIEKRYLHHDFSGFKGDRKFFRDEDAQKAFSKLRSSIGGIYSWRLLQAPVEYRPKSLEQQQRLFKEADFAFKQAFAICPYSPEAVFRYADLLWRPPFNRVDDAILVAKTCLKLDPYNGGVLGLLSNLEAIKGSSNTGAQDAMQKARAELQHLQEEVQKNPNNFPAAIELARGYYQMQQMDAANSLLERVLNATNVDPNTVANVARTYFEVHNFPKLEEALEKYVKLAPDNAEGWYNLAGLKASFYKTNEALASLSNAMRLNATRLQHDPKARDLLPEARKDPQFTPMHSLPEFQKLVPGA